MILLFFHTGIHQKQSINAWIARHILALKNNPKTNPFRLLILWYYILGKDGGKHRAEVKDFSKIAQAEGIKIHAMTFQELIIILERYYREEHPEYIQYLMERYL